EHLPRQPVGVAAWTRPVHRSAVPPQRRPNRPDARPPRPLLLPQLASRAADFALVLRFVRPGALSRQVVPHRLVQQVRIHLRREHVFCQLHLPHLLAFQILYVNDRHGPLASSTILLSGSRCTRRSGPAPRPAPAANSLRCPPLQPANSSTSPARCPCVPENVVPSTRVTGTSSLRFRPAP